jgi:hypothetical protein
MPLPTPTWLDFALAPVESTVTYIRDEPLASRSVAGALIRAARLKWRLDFALAGAWNLAKGGRRVWEEALVPLLWTLLSEADPEEPAEEDEARGAFERTEKVKEVHPAKLTLTAKPEASAVMDTALASLEQMEFFDSQLDLLVKALEDCEAECGSEMFKDFDPSCASPGDNLAALERALAEADELLTDADSEDRGDAA